MAKRLADFLRQNKVWSADFQLVPYNPLVTPHQTYFHREENPFHYLCTVGRGSVNEPEYRAKFIYTTWVDNSRMLSAPTTVEIVSELIHDSLTIYHCPEYQNWLKRYFKSRINCSSNLNWLKHVHARQTRSYRRLERLLGTDKIPCLFTEDEKAKVYCPERSIYPICVFSMNKKSLAKMSQPIVQAQPQSQSQSQPQTHRPVETTQPVRVMAGVC